MDFSVCHGCVTYSKMDFKLFVFITFIIFTSCCASIIPSIEVLQGPSSKTTLLGPDGSAIDSAAPGGTVITNDHGTGLVAAGPAALPLGNAIVVNGPAGSIATSYTAAGPAIVPAVEGTALGIPVQPIVGQVVADEGSYVPDKSESLYDDGSYNGEH